jgi:hypothetical protein
VFWIEATLVGYRQNENILDMKPRLAGFFYLKYF